MSTDDNKALAHRMVEEFWNNKNLDVISEIIALDCPHYMNGIENFKGPEGFRKAAESWIQGFPNMHITIEDQVVEGDKVVSRCKVKAKHDGPLQFALMPTAIPATGKSLDLEMVSIARIADGKMVENWDTGDFSWIQQLAGS